jgi:hypothetical protein
MAEIVKEFSLVCCGMVDTSNTQMNQVLATWDRIGIKHDEKNKNSTAVTSTLNFFLKMTCF